MTMPIPIEHKKRMLLDYLSIFIKGIDPPSEAELNILKTNFPRLGTYFVKGKQETLKKVACFFLLNWGRKRYSYVTPNMIFDSMNKIEGKEIPAVDVENELVIIFHVGEVLSEAQKNLIEAKYLNIMTVRGSYGTPTVLLSTDFFPDISRNFDHVTVNMNGSLSSKGKMGKKKKIISPTDEVF
jgi:hypothetical protein